MTNKDMVRQSTYNGNVVNISGYRYLRQIHGPSIGELVVKKKFDNDKERVKKAGNRQPAW